jgi:HAD superfamily hydrolase (TIGR01509 family)
VPKSSCIYTTIYINNITFSQMKTLYFVLVCLEGVATVTAYTSLLGTKVALPQFRCGDDDRTKVVVGTAMNRRYLRPTSTFTSSLSSLHGTSSHQPLEAILWDMDGVLADTERDGHRPAFNQAFLENDLDTVWDVDRYGELLEIGGGKERMTAHWNGVGWPKTIPIEQQQDIVLRLHLRKTDIFMDMINERKIPLRPGVLRIIDDAITANIKLAVCSTSNVKAVTNLVQTLMGPERGMKFSIFAGDMVKTKKPAPDVYNMAVEEMGLDKSRCVIVEDSHIGLGAAKASGIACIITKSYYTANEDFTGAAMIVDDLGDDTSSGVTIETLAGLLQ